MRKRCVCLWGGRERSCSTTSCPVFPAEHKAEATHAETFLRLQLFPALVLLLPRTPCHEALPFAPHPDTNPARFHRIACVFPGFTAVVSWIAAPCRLSQPAAGTSIFRCQIPFLVGANSTPIVICFGFMELIRCGGLQLHWSWRLED